MVKRVMILLVLILAGNLAWAKPQLGTDGKPLPPHLRNKQPQAQKQQPVKMKQQPGRPDYAKASSDRPGYAKASSDRPQMPGRPNGMDPKRPDLSKTSKARPGKAGIAQPKPGIKGLIKDDFLVNDDTEGVGYYAGYQYDPKAALLPTGEMMVVWYDERNSWDYQIFGRIIDAAGNPVGDDFIVNNFTGSYADCPAVTACGGGFLVTWEDYRSGDDYDIYAQRYGSTGSALGGNFLVNNDGGGYEQYSPSIAANDSGFVITWYDNRSGSSWDIYAQRFNAAGDTIGGNFLVSDAGGSYDQSSPSVAVSDSGFMIAWHDYRNGNSDIYAQRYNAAGDTLGGNFLVDDGGNYQYYPSVAVNDSGYMITWEDYRSGSSWDIYAQRYNMAGDTLGGNFLVNDDGGGYDQYQYGASNIAANDSGFVITWYDYRSGSYWDTYAQRYDQAGLALGGNFIVNDTTSIHCYDPSIAANDSGFAVVWYDTRYNPSGYYDIFCQRYGSTGSPLGGNFMANNDTGTADQWDASVAMDKSGRSVAVWYDLRNDDGSWNLQDQYGQLYDPSGNPVGANFIINDTLAATRRYGYDPRAAFLPDGGFVVTWSDYDMSWYGDIYAQIFDSVGTPVGGNFLVDDGGSEGYGPDVAASDSGFVITWYDYRNGNADIYAQLYKTNGDTIGGNFLVDDGGSVQFDTKVASNGSGYVITWDDYRNGNYDIYAQRFSVNGDTIGGNFLVDDGGNSQYEPSVAMADSGFVISWYDYRYDDSYPDIYAQRYHANGDTIGGNFIVNDDAQGVAYHYYPSVVMSPDGHNMVIAWEDYRNDPSNGDVAEIMAQKYVDGVAVDGNVVVNGTTMSNRYFWGGKRVACNDQKILFNWDDNRRFKGMDTYAKLTDWDLAHIQDAIPPYIVSTSPVNGATGVGLNTPIVIAFSEPMNVSSVDGYPSPDHNFTLSWNATGDTMTMTPDTLYDYSMVMSVIATAGTDTSGNSLAVLPDTFITFTTRDNLGPVITMVQQPSDTYDGNGPFLVRAVINDPAKSKSLATDTLFYTDGNTAFKTTGSYVGADTFEYAIPDTFPAGTIIGYQVKVWDEAGAVGIEPISGAYQFRILNPLSPNSLSGNGTGAGSILLTWNPPVEDLDYTRKMVDYAVAGTNVGDQFSVKFTPQYIPSKLTVAKIIFYSLSGQVEVHVWSDSSGIPGHDLAAPQIISVNSFYPDTTFVPLDVTVYGECHVGIKYLSEPFSFITTDNEDLTGRSQYYDSQTGTWQTLGQLSFGDLFIITTAQYGPDSKSLKVSPINPRAQLPDLKACNIKEIKTAAVKNMIIPPNDPKNFYDYVVEESVSGGAWSDCITLLGLTNTQTGLLNYTWYDYRIRARYYTPDTISYSNVLTVRTDFNGPTIVHAPPASGDTGSYVFYAEMNDSSGILSDTMCYYFSNAKAYQKGGGPSVPDTAAHDSITNGNRYWYHISASYYDTMKYYFTIKDNSLWLNKTTSPLYSFAVETGVTGSKLPEVYVFYLSSVAPNPVKGPAEFRFGLAKGAQASLGIFNVLGQKVKTLVSGQLAAGNHTVKWNGCDDNGRKVSSGVYVYRLTAGENTSTRRFTVIR